MNLFFCPEGARWLQGVFNPWYETTQYTFSRPEDERSPSMPTAFTQNYYHTVFSTKSRAPLISHEFEVRHFPFFGGIVRDLRCQLIAVNGMPDHVHLLVRYRADLSHSDMLRHIKGRSSKWINETFSQLGHFAWQEGYGGFTVSRSAVPDVEAYITNQIAHHQKMDFRTEFLQLLQLDGIEIDEELIFQ
jgi:REP-associated tyrosine transposase